MIETHLVEVELHCCFLVVSQQLGGICRSKGQQVLQLLLPLELRHPGCWTDCLGHRKEQEGSSSSSSSSSKGNRGGGSSSRGSRSGGISSSSWNRGVCFVSAHIGSHQPEASRDGQSSLRVVVCSTTPPPLPPPPPAPGCTTH
jgi:hypothetical protein